MYLYTQAKFQLEEYMDMSEVTLCGASYYEQKYYFNPDFSKLPTVIQEELQIMVVSFVEKVGGVLTMVFDEEGNLLAPEEFTWLAINEQPVAYYHESTVDDGESYSITGRIPVLYN